MVAENCRLDYSCDIVEGRHKEDVFGMGGMFVGVAKSMVE